MRTALVLCLAIAAHAEAADPFTPGQRTMQAAWFVLHFIDYQQTLDIKNHQGSPDQPGGGTVLKEGNPLLGDNPSDSRIRNYFAATALGHYAVSYLLPSSYRSYWQGLTLTGATIIVVRNHEKGLRVQWEF